ncbi:MAG TPA: HD domain-containing protein [Longimicrobiales bacterium]|nr:HD domain-containing protein [Longimicrobiales bacterium]
MERQGGDTADAEKRPPPGPRVGLSVAGQEGGAEHAGRASAPASSPGLAELLPGGERVARQLRFALEVDALKGVLRQTLLTDASRRENSAEHSWHLALLAVLLAEHAPEEVSVRRVVRMVLVHDIVEIDAGDAFCYDPAAVDGKEVRERRAAERIFGLLPADQAAELKALWQEFEAGESPDARFANALDRMQPLLHNFATEGGTWRANGVAHAQVLERMRPIERGAPALWPLVLRILDEARERGWVGG